MYLRTIPPEWRDFEAWPTPKRSSIKQERVERFDKLCKAARLFLKEQPMEEVLEIAGVGERQFFVLMDRALAPRRFGNTIEGARAFVYCIVQAPRQRTAKLRSFAEAYVGFGGAFGKLLLDKPGILIKLEAYLSGQERPNTVTPTLLHSAFLRFVREEGIEESEYPLNTQSRAKKALTRWHKEVWVPSNLIRHIRRQRGPDAATAASYSQGDGSKHVTYPAFTAWVIDAVKVDLRLVVQLPSTRFGVENARIAQVQGLLVRSLAPTCTNLAWHLCLRGRPSADDVLMVLRAAIIGRALGVSPEHAWALKDGAGFPGYLMVALRYAPPLHLFLDNALEHLANEVQQLLTQIGGGQVHLGKPAMPKSRAEIEAAFSRYLVDLVHQLPGATGTGPNDPLRKAAEVPVERSVPYWLLDEASQVYFANENVTSSASAGYLDAMTRLRHLVDSDGLRLNYMPEGRRRPEHFSMPKKVTVKCDLKSKWSRLPYVWFKYRRYSSTWLKARPELRRKTYWARFDTEDLSHIVLVDEMDTEVCRLQCEGEWGMFAHSLQVFKVYARYKHCGMQQPRAYEASIAMVLEYMVKVAPTDARAARDVAFLLHFFKRALPADVFVEVGAEAASRALGTPPPAAPITVPLSAPLPVPRPSPAPAPQPAARPTAGAGSVPAAIVGRSPFLLAFSIPRRFQ